RILYCWFALTVLFASAALPFVQSLRGQTPPSNLEWKVQPVPDWPTSFTALACKGNLCLVAGLGNSDKPPYNWLVIERSDDGGMTWREIRAKGADFFSY